MKKVILLVCLMPSLAYGQVVENFEPGNLNNWIQSSDDRWKADTSESITGRFSLHHIFDNTDAGTDQAGIPLNTLHPDEGAVRWSFTVRHGYDPSSSNNWAVLLMSDTGPETMITGGKSNGYVIGVNLSGYDDTLRLSKIMGNEIITVVSCRINWQTRIGAEDAVRIIVERTTEGIWTVSVYTLDGITINSAEGRDKELFPCEWFGVCFKYSSSRDRLFWFDDLTIDGIFYEDTDVPAIIGCETAGRNALKIALDDQPSDDFMLPENFRLDPDGISAISVIRESALTFIIEFVEEFINKSECSLRIVKLCDRNGNCTDDFRLSFTPSWAETGDVIISEIMADPEPEVSLPDKEYLEITNRTGFTFNLNRWKLTAGDQCYQFPDKVIMPFESLIVCSAQDTSTFKRYGGCIALKQFPVLTDNGKILLLSESYGQLIHGVEYSSEWYCDELKSDGGWSLEMIDTGYPFYAEGNWSASESRYGGTPGTKNSVGGLNPDICFSGALNVFPEDSITVSIKSSEPLFRLKDLTDSVFIDGNSPDDIKPVDPLLRAFSVKLKSHLIRGKIYQFVTSAPIRDFAGNSLLKDSYSFGLPEPAERGDIQFNEILFNPLPGDPDYVEFYNTSGKIIDAARLGLVSVDDDTGDTSQISLVSYDHRCILPGKYYAVTTKTEAVMERYHSADPESLYEAGSLPSMPDDKGHLVLFNRELDKVDEVYYDEETHSSLLSGTEGVALEKISPEYNSEAPGNWHSASESSGWGTPGAQNSIYSELPVAENRIEFSSTKITPDSDGFEDFLLIRFNLKGNMNIVSVTVFDETGNHLRNVVENLYAGPESSVIWDATAEDGSLVGTGIYIILITMFDESGRTDRWKKVCTVIRN